MIEDKPLVLVADDDPDIRSFVAPSLRIAHMHVIEARDGLEALRAVNAHHPAVVVLDIGMPGLDGKAVLRVLKGMGADAPFVIFLTASGMPKDRVEGLRLGAVDYIVKPFNTEELIARVWAAVRMRRRIAEAAG